MEADATPESVPVEKLHSGDPITDCGQRYIVLESKALSDYVVLELESRVDHRLQVIEKSFPAGYHVGRANHRIL
jgi:hypothetical protein